MAYHYSGSWGVLISVFNVERLDLAKWGARCLYFEIFLFIAVSMFHLNYQPTIPFMGAILGAFYLHLIWERYGKEKEREGLLELEEIYSLEPDEPEEKEVSESA